jgi:hypothetical protein
MIIDRSPITGQIRWYSGKADLINNFYFDFYHGRNSLVCLKLISSNNVNKIIHSLKLEEIIP